MTFIVRKSFLHNILDISTKDEDEIYEDFGILYKKYVRRNRKDLGQFFIKETEDIVNQLCDDFERTLEGS